MKLTTALRNTRATDIVTAALVSVGAFDTNAVEVKA